MGKQKSKVEILFDAVGKEYDLGTLEEFEVKIQDDNKRKALFDVIGKDYDLGTFEDFTSKVKKKDLSQSVSPSGFAPSQSFKPGTSPLLPANKQKPYETEVPRPVSGLGKPEPKKQKSSGYYPGLENTAKFAGQTLSALESGANVFNAGLASTPKVAYDWLFAGPIKAMGGDPSLKTFPINSPIGALNAYILYNQGNAEKLMQDANIDPEIQRGIVENIKKGNYSNAFKSAGIGIAQSLPAMAGMAMMGGMTGATTSATMSGYLAKEGAKQTAMAAPFIANKWNEIADDPTMSQPAKIANALVTGYAETFYEDKFGSLALLKTAKEIFKKSGKEAAEQFLKKGFLETMQAGFKKYFPITAPIVNAFEEGSTQWTQNAIAILSGEKPDLDPLQGVGEAMAQGGAFGLAIGASTLPSKFRDKKLIKNVVANNNPEVVDVIKGKLSEQLANGVISQEEHDATMEYVNNTEAINTKVPNNLVGPQREKALDLISDRNILMAEQANLEQESSMADEAFKPKYERQITALQEKINVQNDAILGIEKPIIYRQTEKGYERDVDGKVEEISKEQFDYADTNKLEGISIEHDITEQKEGEPSKKSPTNISSVKIKGNKELTDKQKADLKKLEDEGWTKTTEEDGSIVYTRPKEEVKEEKISVEETPTEEVITEQTDAVELTEEQQNELADIKVQLEDQDITDEERQILEERKASILSAPVSGAVTPASALVENSSISFDRNQQREAFDGITDLENNTPIKTVSEYISKLFGIKNIGKGISEYYPTNRKVNGKNVVIRVSNHEHNESNKRNDNDYYISIVVNGKEPSGVTINDNYAEIRITADETNIEDKLYELYDTFDDINNTIFTITPVPPVSNNGGGNNNNNNNGSGNNTTNSQPTPTRSVEQVRREGLEALHQSRKLTIGQRIKNAISSIGEYYDDDKFRLAKFLKENNGQLAEKYMRLRKGASGAAIAFSQKLKEGIFGGLSFKKKIEYDSVTGAKEKKSEREILDDVITSRRVIFLDKMFSDDVKNLNNLWVKVQNKTATPDEINEYKSLKEYLASRKVIDFDKLNKTFIYQPMADEDGLTIAEQKAYLANLEKQLPKELFDKIIDRASLYNEYFSELLQRQYDNGLINDAQFQALSRQEYSPRAFWEHILRMDEDQQLGDKTFFTKLNQGLKQLSGGTNKLVYGDYEALLDIATVGSFKRMLENDAANELAIFADKNKGNGYIEVAEPIPNKKDKYGNPVYEPAPSGKGYIVYFDNGVKKRLLVDAEYEKIWYDSRDGISPETAKALRTWLGVNLIKKGATEWNLAFGILQFALLDAPHVFLFTDTYNSILPIGAGQFLKDVNAVRKDLYNKKGIWKEASEAGAFADLLSREHHSIDPSKYSYRDKGAIRKAGEAFVDFSGNVNEYMETLTRLAVYNRTKTKLIEQYKKDNGNNPIGKDLKDIIAESAFAAKNTVDFSKSGIAAKSGNNVFAYLNAAIQTFNKSVTSLKEDPIKTSFKIAQLGSVAVATTLFSLGMGADDEEKKRKRRIYEDIPNFVKRTKFWYIPSKSEEPIFRAMGLINDNVHYIAFMPKPTLAAYFINTMEDAAVNYYMPEVETGDKLENLTLDLRNTLPFNPENIVSRNPFVSASLAAANFDFFKKRLVVANEENKADYTEGQSDPSVAPIYKGLGTLSKEVGIGGADGISPKRTQAIVEKLITNPEKNPVYSLVFQPASYAVVKAIGDKELEKELVDRFDISFGFKSRIMGYESRRKQDNSTVEEAKDKDSFEYEGKKLLRTTMASGLPFENAEAVVKKIFSREVLDKYENLDLTKEDKERMSKEMLKYAKQVNAIYNKGMPEWFAEIPLQKSNEEKAKEIIFRTNKMSVIERDRIIKQLEDNAFITKPDNSPSKSKAVRNLVKELSQKQ